jgi:hypoxanthine-DNA glycosylase
MPLPVPLPAPAPWAEGLPPVLSARTRLLVLGSFPGVASLQAQQYYAHPRNQFWPILGRLWGLDLAAMPYAQRLEVLLQQGLGLWDLYARCRRPGSLDQAIEEAEPNPLHLLPDWAPALQAVAHNGAESARGQRALAALGYRVHRLPSTSPANARWSFERKCQAWAEVFAACGLATAPGGR